MVDEELSADTELTPEEKKSARLWHRRVDIVVVLLLGLGSVLATWAGYQAGQWSELKAESAILVEDLKQAADRSVILGYQDRQLDVSLFMAWLEAHMHQDTQIAEFYEKRFVAHFRPAFDAWIATDPFNNPEAPLDPFRMPEYTVPALQDAASFNAQAAQISKVGEEFRFYADAYVFLTVLVAVVLFIGGVATKAGSQNAQIALLVLAWVMLGFCIVRASTLPNAGAALPATAEIQILQAAQQATPVR